MTRFLHLALAAALVATLVPAAAVWAQASASAKGPSGDAVRGGEIYIADGCYACHGYAGQGGAGPKLAPDPRPAQVISAYIRTPAGVMPPYSVQVLPERDVTDIAAWLGTIPQSPPASRIPLLKNLCGGADQTRATCSSP